MFDDVEDDAKTKLRTWWSMVDDICGRYAGDYQFELKGKKMELSVEDVGKIMCVPYEGLRVDLEKGDENIEFWKEYFKGKELDRSMIEEILKLETTKDCNNEEKEDDICRLWLCIIFNTFLLPTSRMTLRKTLLIYIE